jgi:hypothetical protein
MLLLGLVCAFYEDGFYPGYQPQNTKAPQLPFRALLTKQENLIPACVVWYVGGRGQLIKNIELRSRVVRMLDNHLFLPLKDELQTTSSNSAGQLWKVVKNASRLIQSVDEELQERA